MRALDAQRSHGSTWSPGLLFVPMILVARVAALPAWAARAAGTTVRMPVAGSARAAVRMPATGSARALGPPVALAVPVVPVVRLAVVIEVVVAATPVPVVTPTRVPVVAGTPVVVRERRGGSSLGDGRGAQTGEP